MNLFQTDSSSGTFRPLDDILELATEKILASPPYEPDPKDPSTFISKEDITTFLSLDCAHSAMKRICEVKGASYSSFSERSAHAWPLFVT